jgi:hypothetical protein
LIGEKMMKHTAILRSSLTTLALLLMLAGCSNPVSPPAPVSGPAGRVTFAIGGAERAVLPSVNQFGKITLSFDGQGDAPDLTWDFTGNTVAVDITTAGSWEASVQAYIGEEDPEPAAVSSAAKTVSWAGSGPVMVEGGDTRFFLVSAATDGRPGKLKYAVTLPENDFALGAGSRIRIEQEGAAVDLDIGGFTNGERAITASIAATDLALDAGLYAVDIRIVKDNNTVAVYRKSVSILSGLITEIGFEAEDFLDPATAAAVVALGEEPFKAMDDDDTVNSIDFIAGAPSTLAIGTVGETVFFTLTKSADQTVEIDKSGDWGDVTYVAEGNEPGDSTATLAVFIVNDIEEGSEKKFTLTVTEPGTTGSIAVNVTVTRAPKGFGLYSKAADAEESAYAPVSYVGSTLNDMLDHLANVGNITADTSYLILLDRDQTIAPWVSAVAEGKIGVEIILRGIDMQGGENWKVTWDETTLGNGLLSVGTGTTLTLDEGITLDGAGKTVSLVYVANANNNNEADASFVMREGSKLVGAYNATSSWGSYGSAVTVLKGGSSTTRTANFTMEGGEISGNTGYTSIVYIGGIGLYGSGGNFTMEGGKITGNTLVNNGNGVNISNQGKAVHTIGNFVLKEGEISNHNMPGVYVEGSFAMEGGKISNNGTGTYSNGNSLVGAGLSVCNSNGDKRITGGEISGNGGVYGSAIYCWSTTLGISGAVHLEGNIAIFSQSYLLVDSSFTNLYSGIIPITIVAGNSVGFTNNWVANNGVYVLKPLGEGSMNKELVDKFGLAGGMWHTPNGYIGYIDGTASMESFCINEDGTFGAKPIQPIGVWFGEETSLSVEDGDTNIINSGELKEVTGNRYSITLQNASAYDDIVWHINGAKSPVTGPKLTLDTTRKGLAQVTVEAYKSDGVVDTGTFRFDVK